MWKKSPHDNKEHYNSWKPRKTIARIYKNWELTHELCNTDAVLYKLGYHSCSCLLLSSQRVSVNLSSAVQIFICHTFTIIMNITCPLFAAICCRLLLGLSESEYLQKMELRSSLHRQVPNPPCSSSFLRRCVERFLVLKIYHSYSMYETFLYLSHFIQMAYQQDQVVEEDDGNWRGKLITYRGPLPQWKIIYEVETWLSWSLGAGFSNFWKKIERPSCFKTVWKLIFVDYYATTQFCEMFAVNVYRNKPWPLL